MSLFFEISLKTSSRLYIGSSLPIFGIRSATVTTSMPTNTLVVNVAMTTNLTIWYKTMTTNQPINGPLAKSNDNHYKWSHRYSNVSTRRYINAHNKTDIIICHRQSQFVTPRGRLWAFYILHLKSMWKSLPAQQIPHRKGTGIAMVTLISLWCIND